MNKVRMKTSNEFHNSVISSLKMIQDQGEIIMKRNNFRRFASVAASFILIVTIAVIGADATGVIDIDSAFKKLFHIEYDEDKQKIMTEISSEALPTATGNGVTVKVAQSINDTRFGAILLEFTAEENILHEDMLPHGMNLEVEGCNLSYSSGKPHFTRAKTIEQAKAEYEQGNIGYTTKQPKDFTDKIYLLISFQSDGNLIGENKEISLRLNSLKLFDSDSSKEEKNLDLNISLNWKLSDYLHCRSADLDTGQEVFDIPADIYGIKVEFITLTPISYTLTLAEPVNFNEGTDVAEGELDNEGKLYLQGFRFKDGSTRYVQKGVGYLSPTEVSGTFFDIIDVDEVTSVFLGDFLEVQLTD